MISDRPAGHRSWHSVWACQNNNNDNNVVVFSETEFDKRQILHDDISYWDVPIHTTFNDLDIFDGHSIVK